MPYCVSAIPAKSKQQWSYIFELVPQATLVRKHNFPVLRSAKQVRLFHVKVRLPSLLWRITHAQTTRIGRNQYQQGTTMHTKSLQES